VSLQRVVAPLSTAIGRATDMDRFIYVDEMNDEAQRLAARATASIQLIAMAGRRSRACAY